MKAAYTIILSPVISEKGTALSQKENKVVFSVDPRANKIEIRKAIEELYPVKVVKVNVANCPGKNRRYKNKLGKTSSWKKAVITLREGNKIEFT